MTFFWGVEGSIVGPRTSGVEGHWDSLSGAQALRGSDMGLYPWNSLHIRYSLHFGWQLHRVKVIAQL